MSSLVFCKFCGKPVHRPPNKVKGSNFCSRSHFQKWTRKKHSGLLIPMDEIMKILAPSMKLIEEELERIKRK